MTQTFHYLYKKRIVNHGWNDGYEETDQTDLLLHISDNPESILNDKNWFEFRYYKSLEENIILSEEQIDQVKSFFGPSADLNWSKALETISFADFKRLYATLQLEFTTIKKCETNPNSFYPLINHVLLSSLGLKTMRHHELEELVDQLTSDNADEAFEKGLFFLLLNNAVPSFIGDPETTGEEAEFIDQHHSNRKKMLEFFGAPVNHSLISKHNCLKFWLNTEPYKRYDETFNHFFSNKAEILENNLDHFNDLVSYFRNHKEKIIYVVNVC